jgi:hypothetical protein
MIAVWGVFQALTGFRGLLLHITTLPRNATPSPSIPLATHELAGGGSGFSTTTGTWWCLASAGTGLALRLARTVSRKLAPLPSLPRRPRLHRLASSTFVRTGKQPSGRGLACKSHLDPSPRHQERDMRAHRRQICSRSRPPSGNKQFRYFPGATLMASEQVDGCCRAATRSNTVSPAIYKQSRWCSGTDGYHVDGFLTIL